MVSYSDETSRRQEVIIRKDAIGEFMWAKSVARHETVGGDSFVSLKEIFTQFTKRLLP